jgi:Ca2+-binding RTX toxin-like protein
MRRSIFTSALAIIVLSAVGLVLSLGGIASADHNAQCPSYVTAIYHTTDEADNLLLTNESDCADVKGGRDILSTLGGADHAWGGDGGDDLYGGDGSDYLYGENGHDVLSGGASSDDLDGGQQDDEIAGHAGSDTLFGGGDDDILWDGTGTNDAVLGGAGFDTWHHCHSGDFNDYGVSIEQHVHNSGC